MASKIFSGVSLTAGISMLAAPIAFAPSAAYAGTTCPSSIPAATAVANGVCQVKFTSDGTFAVPAGVTKISALIVGGGSGGSDVYAYAGNGGEVVYVDSVDLSTDLSITVGAGGLTNADGGSSSVNSDTALGATTMASGSGHSGALNPTTGTCVTTFAPGGEVVAVGGGAKADAVDWQHPGAGYVPSDPDLAADATLWPVIAGEIEYGKGGLGCTDAAVPANTGQGGNGWPDGAVGPVHNGSAGVVLLRFTGSYTPDSLAATGSSTGWYSFAGALLVVAGVAARRRTRKN